MSFSELLNPSESQTGAGLASSRRLLPHSSLPRPRRQRRSARAHVPTGNEEGQERRPPKALGQVFPWPEMQQQQLIQSPFRQGLNASLLPSGLDPSLCRASLSCQGLAPYWSIPACTREAHHPQQTSCWSCKREVIRLRTSEEREAARPRWSCPSRAAFGPRR